MIRARMWRRVALVVALLIVADFALFLMSLRGTRSAVMDLHYKGRISLLEDAGGLARCDDDPARFDLPDRGGGRLVALRPDGSPFAGDLGVYAEQARAIAPDVAPGTYRLETSDPVWPVVVALDREGPCNLFFLTPPMANPGKPLAEMAALRLFASACFVLVLVFMIVRPLTRRIRRLAEDTRALANGGFAGEVSAGQDELGDIADVVNEAAARARTMIDAEATQRQMLHELFADLSHDIRTPLASMKLSADALAHGDDPAEVMRSLRAELEYLDAMFANLATIARLRSAVLPITLRAVELGPIVERARTRFQPVAGDRGVQVEFAVPEAPVHVMADPLTLEQALGNVVHNAIKFARGNVAIVLDARAEHAEVRVVDDGPGFPEEDLARLTDRRFKGADSGGRGGLGLGLAIAEQILARHGGELALSMHEDGGAQVTLRLPLQGQRR